MAEHGCCVPQPGQRLSTLLSCRVPEDDGGGAVKDQTFLRPAAAPSPAPPAAREQQLHCTQPLAPAVSCPVPAPLPRLSFSSARGFSVILNKRGEARAAGAGLNRVHTERGLWPHGPCAAPLAGMCVVGACVGHAHAAGPKGSAGPWFPREAGPVPVLSSDFPCRAAGSCGSTGGPGAAPAHRGDLGSFQHQCYTRNPVLHLGGCRGPGSGWGEQLPPPHRVKSTLELLCWNIPCPPGMHCCSPGICSSLAPAAAPHSLCSQEK